VKFRSVLATLATTAALTVGLTAPASADDIIPGDAKAKYATWDPIPVAGVPSGWMAGYITGNGNTVRDVGGLWAAAAGLCEAHMQVKYHYGSQSEDPTGYEWNQDATVGCSGAGQFKVTFPENTVFENGQMCINMWERHWDRMLQSVCFNIHP
jgi:hypothetical protein